MLQHSLVPARLLLAVVQSVELEHVTVAGAVGHIVSTKQVPTKSYMQQYVRDEGLLAQSLEVVQEVMGALPPLQEAPAAAKAA